MYSTSKEYSQKINATKTKTLVCNKNNMPTINITLENKVITQVYHFKYLFEQYHRRGQTFIVGVAEIFQKPS